MRHMAKKRNAGTKKIVHQFHVRNMTHTMQKNIRINREKVIKDPELSFKPVTLKSIKSS